MSNYYANSRTNYFQVTDEAKFAELFANLVSDGDEVYDFTKVVDGVTLHAFGSYGAIDYQKSIQNNNEEDDEDYDYDFDSFLEELQKILHDDEAFIYTECGHEKLRYISGISIVVTKNKIESFDIHSRAVELAREMLNNKDFQTQMDY